MADTVDNREIIAPYLIAGLSEEDVFKFMEDRLGHESCVNLAAHLEENGIDGQSKQQQLLLFGLTLYRRERLLKMWDDPQSEEEKEIMRALRADSPLGLHTLLTDDEEKQKIDGVSPVLCPLGQGEYRLGWEAELGPIFAAITPQDAIRQAFDWMSGAVSNGGVRGEPGQVAIEFGASDAGDLAEAA